METYVVLFRGINVGGHNILPMNELKDALGDAGFGDITTYIQSGNVVLRSQKAPAAEIREIVENSFGFKPEAIALSASEFVSAVRNNPFDGKDRKIVHVYFCKSAPKVDEEELRRLRSEPEEYYLGSKVFYLFAPNGIGRSRLAMRAESCLGVPTMANGLLK